MTVIRAIKLGAAVIGLLLSCWALLAWSEWLPRITESQRQALAQMREGNQQAVGQRNAWQLFWLLPYQIPEAERAAVLAQDIAALDAIDIAPPPVDLQSVAEGRYPRRWAKDAPRHRFCSSEGDCLAEVRADPEAAAAELASAQGELDALNRLADYDHLQIPHRPSLASPIPPFARAVSLPLLEAALRFEQGDPTAALTGLCRNAAAWRGLKGRADNLIFEMLNVSQLMRNAQLYAQLRAELPADFALPAVCAQAFAAPRPEERQACDVYRFEFRLNESLMQPGVLEAMEGGEEWSRSIRGWGAELLINQEATLAISAENFASLCAAIPRPIKQSPELRRPADQGCGFVGRLFNPVGCILSAIGTPAYTDYWYRDRDWEGSLRLLQLADWMAEQPDPAAAFAYRPAALDSFEQPLSFADGELAIKLLKPRSKPLWAVALPGSRVVQR